LLYAVVNPIILDKFLLIEGVMS